jgi:hypothetical protein
MQKFIYGTDTGSIEDYHQCVVLVLSDDEVEQLDYEPVDPLTLGTQQTLCTWEDMVDSLILAARAEGIDTQALARIIATVRDALDNND